MADDFDIVAERMLICRNEESKKEWPIRIVIGRPYWITPDTEAACPVDVQGLLDHRSDIRGEGLLGALYCALFFVKTYLSDRSDVKIFWPDGEEYTPEQWM